MSFSTLLDALRPYQHLDLEGWLQVGRALPAASVLGIIALGATLLAFGPTRPSAALLGGLAGLAWAAHVFDGFGVYRHEAVIAFAAGLTLTGAGALWPPVASAAIWGVPAGLLVGGWVGGLDFAAGFVPGFVVGGITAALVGRASLAVAAAGVGSWLLVIGLGALFHLLPRPHAPRRAELPLLELVAALALVDLAFQSAFRGFQRAWQERLAQRLARRIRLLERRLHDHRWKGSTRGPQAH